MILSIFVSFLENANFNLIYDLEAVAALLQIFMGLALVHFQKYLLLMLIPSFFIHSKNKLYSINSPFFLHMYSWHKEVLTF